MVDKESYASDGINKYLVTAENPKKIPYQVDSEGIIQLTSGMEVHEDEIIELTDVYESGKPPENDKRKKPPTLEESRETVAVVGTPYDVDDETVKELKRVFHGFDEDFVVWEFASFYHTDPENSLPLLARMGYDIGPGRLKKIIRSMGELDKNRYFSADGFFTPGYKERLKECRKYSIRARKRHNHSTEPISLPELGVVKSELIQELFLSKMKRAKDYKSRRRP